MSKIMSFYWFFSSFNLSTVLKNTFLCNVTKFSVANGLHWHYKLQCLFCVALYNQWKGTKSAVPLKTLLRFRPGVNFTNILLAAFAPKSFRQKITNPNCKHLKGVQRTLVWLSISPIFYKQLFHTKVNCAPFMCLQFVFVIFWWKDFGAKAAHKMLVKLTPVSFCLFAE